MAPAGYRQPPYISVILAQKIRFTLPFNLYRMLWIKAYLEICAERQRLPDGVFFSDARDAVALGDVWGTSLSHTHSDMLKTVYRDKDSM